MNLRNDYKKSEIATCDHVTGTKRNKSKGLKNYCERSKVPIELYKHILSIYEGKEQLTLF
jgi:hypothetical protein